MSQKLRQNESEASLSFLDLKMMRFFNSVGYLPLPSFVEDELGATYSK
jgi:hypothetical protein